MANLLLTTDCQRNCSYCFAQENKDKHQSFTWQNFMSAVSFVATGPKALNLLGGEPTLHPEFMNMLEYLIVNDYIIQVFTNGMIKQDLLDDITSLLNRVVLREQQLLFAVNVNEEKYRTEEENRRQLRFLNSMSRLAFPSFTIHELTDLSFLQRLVEDYYLDPAIRLGLAMPVATKNNKYLPLELYPGAAIEIFKLAQNSPGTIITFDCGFPFCMFTSEEIGELAKNKENDLSFICGSPLDIHPDLSITNCYPLANMWKKHIQDFDNIIDAYRWLTERVNRFDGIYGDRCKECPFFKTICLGGCKGFKTLTEEV